MFNLARISSCQNISLVLWLLNHAEVRTTVAVSVSLKEHKHGSVCSCPKLEGQCVDIFILFSLIIKDTCNNGYWVLIRIPFPELRWCLFLCSSFLPRMGKKGSWKMNCTQSFPPPSSTVCEQSKNIYAFGKECVLE